MFIYVYLCLFVLIYVIAAYIFQSCIAITVYFGRNCFIKSTLPRNAFGLPPSGCQLKILQILPIKLFDKILEPYLVRWSLLYLDVAA